MKKKVAFRFDIDTLKCIKYGVPRLVNISKKNEVKFTFFMNFGKSIDRKIIFQRKNNSYLNSSTKLPTIKKLGIINYLLTILVNPNLNRYSDQINQLSNSENEIGLHGGLNHGTWQLNGENFPLSKVKNEIEFGLLNAKKYNIKFHGFTSPGMTSNKFLPKVLNENNFSYISDTFENQNEHEHNERKLILKGIKNIDVNIIGKDGVGYFEYNLAKNNSPKEIMENLYDHIMNSESDTFILYDHPLIIDFIEEEFENFIIRLKNSKVEFVKFNELVN